jgi:hypothetical protein
MKKVFISYSWEDEDHKTWVKKLATDLRNYGIESRLDAWNLSGGDKLPFFMEKEIRDNDFVLIICTPKYKEKSNNRIGGVGYEGDIISAELFNNQNDKKFILILRKGIWINSAPTNLLGKYYFDLSDDIYSKNYDNMFNDLCACILDIKEDIPPVQEPPIEKLKAFKNSSNIQKNSFIPIKINKILINEVTTPRMDGSKGCALYTIPFELSNYPNNEWKTIFVKKWNHPSQFSSMHRPSIASISGKKIILNGTTIEEVKKYHRDTLVLCIEETNDLMSKIEKERNQRELQEKIKENEHYQVIKNIADNISF